MTRLMLWTLMIAVVLLLGGVLAQMMIQDAGIMMLTWNGWMVETTFWSGIGALISVFVIGVLLVALFRRFGPVNLIRKYRNRRDQKAAKKETLVAIESWLKGNDERALQAMGRVIDAGGSDRLPSAVSLAIGLQQSDWHTRYGEFVAKDPELKRYADVLHAERLWQNQKEDDFIDLMLGRFELRQVPWLRERFWQSMLSSGKAKELVTLVNEAPNIQPEVRERWLEDATRAALLDAQGQQDVGSQIFKPLSKTQRNLPGIVSAEINYLVSISDHDGAFKRAKQIVNRGGQTESVDILLDIQVDNNLKLSLLENATPSQPGPVFCRVIGELSMRQQLWGNAQSWFEQSWKQGDKQAGLLLAQLFEQRNMHDQAARLYRELATGLIPIN